MPSPLTTDYIPYYRPAITDQLSEIADGNYAGWWGNHLSCVGHALANVLNILYFKHTGNPKTFSHAYIYGKRKTSDDQGEGQYSAEALNNFMSSGYGFVEYSNCPGDAFYLQSVNRYYVYLSEVGGEIHPPQESPGNDYLNFGSSYNTAKKVSKCGNGN